MVIAYVPSCPEHSVTSTGVTPGIFRRRSRPRRSIVAVATRPPSVGRRRRRGAETGVAASASRSGLIASTWLRRPRTARGSGDCAWQRPALSRPRSSNTMPVALNFSDGSKKPKTRSPGLGSLHVERGDRLRHALGAGRVGRGSVAGDAALEGFAQPRRGPR